MKKIFLPALSAIILFAGCAKEETESPSSVAADVPQVLTASVAPQSKVNLDGLKTSWHSTDAVSVFWKSNEHHKYAYKEYSDESDQASAIFAYHSKPEVVENVINLERNYAIYPSRASYDNTVYGDGVMTTRVVFGQEYRESNNLRYSPMFAVSDNGQFNFRNIGSILRFNIKKSENYIGSFSLETINLSSKSQVMSGHIEVDIDNEEWRGVASNRHETPAHNKNVQLKDINVDLTSEAQPFNISVFAAEFPENDLTIEFVYNGGKKRTVVYPKALSLGVNCVQDIDCTIKPGPTDNVEVITGGLHQFNGFDHISCYTATVEGTVNSDNISEIGVIFQRTGKTDAAVAGLVYEKVGTIGGSTGASNATNNVRKQVASSTDAGNVIVKLTDLAGGDGASTYIYRYYAICDGAIVYGDVNTFRTEKYGQFIMVEAGTFTMGADEGQDGYVAGNKTSPAHKVTLTKDFEIGKYEVTQGEFAEFLNANTSFTTSGTNAKPVVKDDPYTIFDGTISQNSLKIDKNAFTFVDKKRPVAGVTYYGAVKYCEWLTQSKNDGYTYRLPTEAEWEYAARGGNASQGYKYSGSNILAEVGVYKGLYKADSAYIGRNGELYPNELGIYDMSGNLWEFVSDRNDRDWQTPSGEAASYFEYCFEYYKDGVTDPQGPQSVDGYSFTSDNYYCLRKGGSCNDGSGGANFCPGYRRTDSGNGQNYTHAYAGFRIVRVKNNES